MQKACNLKFEVEALRKVEELEEGEVDVLRARTGDRVAIDVTEGALCGIGEGACIEVGAGDAWLAVWIAQIVRALRAADVAPAIGNVGEVGCICSGVPVAGGECNDATDLPVADKRIKSLAGATEEALSLADGQWVESAKGEAMANVRIGVAVFRFGH